MCSRSAPAFFVQPIRLSMNWRLIGRRTRVSPSRTIETLVPRDSFICVRIFAGMVSCPFELIWMYRRKFVFVIFAFPGRRSGISRIWPGANLRSRLHKYRICRLAFQWLWQLRSPFTALALREANFPSLALHSSIPMASKKNLELRRQVGQLLIMGFDGTAMSQRLRVMLDSLQPSGIILFKRNLEHAEQTHALLSGAHKTIGTPLFLCVDMEGGTVDRLRDVIAPIPSVSEVAVSGSKKLFRRHGRLIGEQVRALGFNTDFAPVFDLQFEESKSVLGSRTVSQSPKETIVYARAFLHGLRDADVLGCGKHFPGLGAAHLDTHADLPSIDKKWKAMWKEDLAPYRKLHRDLPFVMVAHAAYPQVTGDHTPASLSKKWMSGILRKKIGYEGLIITDDLDMGGVLAAASIEDAAVETLRAGADMFLVCQKEESVRRAFEAVLKLAETDKKFARLVAEKSARVLKAKKKSKALRAPMAPPPGQKTVERLTRKVWQFSEELRLRLVSTEQVGG